jgi:hypothetical protein
LTSAAQPYNGSGKHEGRRGLHPLQLLLPRFIVGRCGKSAAAVVRGCGIAAVKVVQVCAAFAATFVGGCGGLAAKYRRSLRRGSLTNC